ncbi:MAG: tetratricopeptide repeat protein [Nitrospirota bacterium]
MKKIKKRVKKAKKFIMRIDPRVEEAVDDALAMVATGKLRAAEKSVSELLREHSDIHSVQFAMGLIRALQNRHEEAIGYFDKAIEIYPYFVEAWFNKGASHEKLLEFEEVIKAFQKVVEFGDPNEDFVREVSGILKELENNIRRSMGLSMDNYLKGRDTFNSAFEAMENGEWERPLRGFVM